jgi:hypothetical protein
MLGLQKTSEADELEQSGQARVAAVAAQGQTAADVPIGRHSLFRRDCRTEETRRVRCGAGCFVEVERWRDLDCDDEVWESCGTGGWVPTTDR